MAGVALLPLFFINKASAEEIPLIVINEVMANPQGDDNGFEWIELKNNSDQDIELEYWKLKIFNATKLTDTIVFNSINILPNDYLILPSLLQNQPCDNCSVYFNEPFSLTNSAGKVVLENFDGSYSYELSWDEDDKMDSSTNAGHSMAIVGPPDDTEYSAWNKSNKIGGTPGLKNDEALPIEFSDEVLELIDTDNAVVRQAKVIKVIDGDTIEVEGLTDFPAIVRLLYVNCPEEAKPFYQLAKEFTSELVGQDIQLLISGNSSQQVDLYDRTLAVAIFEDSVFNTQILENGLSYYINTANSLIKNEAWLNIMLNAQQEKVGIWESASEIVISELLPNPIGDDASGEWIELYNPTSSEVNLASFMIDGYSISQNTTIDPKSYKVFYRNQTSLALNNSSDSVKLFLPGGLLIDQATYSLATEGSSWAIDGHSWSWTSTPTPGKTNVITIDEEDELDDMGGDDIDIISVNSNPIETKTGEFKNHENQLVKITGEVVATSGSTFWLDDGSGPAKVYIQAKTKIEKPRMQRGDLVEVIGIVNLYRESWRILPQKQDDIKVLKAVVPVKIASASTKSVAAKKTNAKATKKVAASNNKARAPNIQSNSLTSNTTNKTQEDFWLQFVKALTAFAIVLLVVFLFKVLRFRKESVIGGHFGEDET